MVLSDYPKLYTVINQVFQNDLKKVEIFDKSFDSYVLICERVRLVSTGWALRIFRNSNPLPDRPSLSFYLFDSENYFSVKNDGKPASLDLLFAIKNRYFKEYGVKIPEGHLWTA